MLDSLYDFVNSEGIFPTVAPPERFCLLIINGLDKPCERITFSFYNTNFEMIKDKNRMYTLTLEQIEKAARLIKKIPNAAKTI